MGFILKIIKKVYREIKYLLKIVFLITQLLVKFGLVAAIIIGIVFGATTVLEMGVFDDSPQISTDGGTEIEPSPKNSENSPQNPPDNSASSIPDKTVAGNTYNAAEIEEAVERRLNEYRRQQGVGELETPPSLRENARDYSRDMGQRNFYSHTTPGGMGVQQRIDHVPGCDDVGENLHQVWVNRNYRAPDGEVVVMDSQQEVIDYLMDSWKESSGHNRNMLKSKWEMVGVGVYVEDNGDMAKIFATQHFCR